LRRGAEGPGALQVPIKTLMAVIELEGCSPLQPGEAKKDQGWMTHLVPGNKASGAEGPDAFQQSISR